MTKLDLSMVLWQFKEGKKSHTDCLTAVDAYTDALIAAKPDVSGRSELLLAFAEWIAKDTITGLLGTPEYYVERFLKANNSH